MILLDVFVLLLLAFFIKKTRRFRSMNRNKYWSICVLVTIILKPLLYWNFKKNLIYLPRCYNDFRDNPYSCSKYIAGNYIYPKLEDVERIEEENFSLFYPLWFIGNSISSVYHELQVDHSSMDYLSFFNGRLYQLIYKTSKYHTMSYLTELANSNRYDIFFDVSLYAKEKWYSNEDYMCRQSDMPFQRIEPNINNIENEKNRKKINELYLIYSKDLLNKNCSRYFQITFALLANVGLKDTIISFFKSSEFLNLTPMERFEFVQILDSSMSPEIIKELNNPELENELLTVRKKLCTQLGLQRCN